MNDIAAWNINERYQDGWDFCDSVREEAGNGSLAKVAAVYERVLGDFPDGYTMSDFKALDRREGRN